MVQRTPLTPHPPQAVNGEALHYAATSLWTAQSGPPLPWYLLRQATEWSRGPHRPNGRAPRRLLRCSPSRAASPDRSRHLTVDQPLR
jgi:hypothetical protein